MGRHGSTPVGDDGTKQQKRPWMSLGVIFVAGVMSFAILLIGVRTFENYRLREEVIAQAERENIAFVTVVDRFTRHMADALGFVFNSFDLEGWDANTPEEVAERLRDQADQLVRVNVDFIRVDIVSPAGEILYSTDILEIGRKLAQDGLVERASRTNVMVFGTAEGCEDCPVPYYFTVAKRLSRRDGRHLGTVVARIDPRKLQSLSGTIGENFSGIVRITLDDGTLLISEPPAGLMPGSKVELVSGSFADLDRSGHVVMRPWDYSKDFLVTYSFIPEYKLFVSFLRSKEIVLAGVRQAIWQSITLGLITLVTCVIASALFYRMLRMRANVSERLAEKRAELENIQQASRIAGFRWFPATGELTSAADNSRVIDLGHPVAGGYGIKDLLRLFPQEEAQALRDAVIDCAKTGAEHHLEVTANKKAGQTSASTFAITTFRISGAGHADESGTNHVFLVCQDISEWHDTRMQHAHLLKIEAVGQITGGVAHDFNNLLVVILGNIEEIAGEFPVGDPRHTLLDVTLGAAMQARDLTKRLLAFARKQTLQPTSISISALVENMRSLLRRTIGENIVLTFDIEPGMKTWNVRADRTQLETAILNLIINARDALVGGGNITVRVRNRVVSSNETLSLDDIAPGEYLDIMVEDNGTGMSLEVAERAIEPYFTTKPPGAGSGLGLSQVYGFVKQSGGHFQIHTQAMSGTIVHMLLPRADPALKETNGLPEEWSDGFEFGNETILVVEDDEAVRAHVDRVLSSLGYKVLSRIDGKSALELVEEGASFDLLLTDVMLPGGMSGVQLARKVRELRPDVPVMYVSGYAKDMIDEGGRTTADIHFLQKPFLRGELGKKVRAALGSAS